MFVYLFTDLLWKTNVEVSSFIKHNCERTGRQLYLIKFHNFEKLSTSVTFSLQSIRLRLSYVIKILSSSFSRSMKYAATKSNTTSILLTLCQGYKLFTPNFSSAYLTFFSM